MRLNPAMISGLALASATRDENTGKTSSMVASLPQTRDAIPTSMHSNLGRNAFAARMCVLPDVFVPVCVAGDDQAALSTMQEIPATTIRSASTDPSAPSASATRQAVAPLDLLLQHGYSVSEAKKIVRAYEKASISLNDKTMPGQFQDKNRVGRMKEIGSGANNVAWAATYRTANAGQTKKIVFKQADTGGSLFLPKQPTPMGPVIGLTVPERTTVRNVASFELNQLLSWKVIPRTEFALHKGKLGIAMDFIDGKHPSDFMGYSNTGMDKNLNRLLKYREVLDEYPDGMGVVLQHEKMRRINFAPNGKAVAILYGKSNGEVDYISAVLLRETTKLQVFDHISGEGDRNHANWLVETAAVHCALNVGESRPIDVVVGVKGIDNDMSFGPKKQTARELSVDSNFAAWLPPIIDSDIYRDVMRIEDHHLQNGLDGLVSAEEIDATKFRLGEIREHFQELEKNGAVIHPDDWHTVINDERMNPMNSYFVREKTDLHDLPVKHIHV